MNVRMMEEILSPGVEHAKKTDVGSKVFRIGSNFQQTRSTGAEQQTIELAMWLHRGHLVQQLPQAPLPQVPDQCSRQVGWLARNSELLPVPYVHVVFTLPHQLAPLVFHNKQICLRLHPPPVFTQGLQQFRAQGHVAVTTPLSLADANQHAGAIDVLNFQSTYLGSTHACRVGRH